MACGACCSSWLLGACVVMDSEANALLLRDTTGLVANHSYGMFLTASPPRKSEQNAGADLVGRAVSAGIRC